MSRTRPGPRRLTFIVADTLTTERAVECLQEHRPFQRRAVTIELTPSQRDALRLRYLGASGNRQRFEEVLDVFVEQASEEREP